MLGIWPHQLEEETLLEDIRELAGLYRAKRLRGLDPLIFRRHAVLDIPPGRERSGGWPVDRAREEWGTFRHV